MLKNFIGLPISLKKELLLETLSMFSEVVGAL